MWIIGGVGGALPTPMHWTFIITISVSIFKFSHLFFNLRDIIRTYPL